jgi:hypothetical protein
MLMPAASDSPGTASRHDYGQQNQRFSMSYITGSHAFRPA